MKLLAVFGPDPELGIDPSDPDHYDAITKGLALGDKDDVLLVYRQWSEELPGGSRTVVIGQGIYENVTAKAIEKLLRLK